MSAPISAPTLRLATVPSPVHQTNFTPSKGNALQACAASLFDVPLDRVPNFVELDCGYEQGIRNFCEEGGLMNPPRKVKLGQGSGGLRDEDVSKLCILRGKSPRGDYGHVVVARVVASSSVGGGFEMVHDPHPDATYLDEGDDFGWCMMFD